MSDYKEDIVIAASIDTKGMKSGANEIENTLNQLNQKLDQNGPAKTVHDNSNKWLRLTKNLFSRYFGEIGQSIGEAMSVYKDLKEAMGGNSQNSSNKSTLVSTDKAVATAIAAQTAVQAASVKDSAIGFGKLAISIGAIGVALAGVAVIMSYIKEQKAIRKLADDFQITTEEAHKLHHLLKSIGDNEGLTKGIQKLADLLEQVRLGSMEARDALRELGVVDIWASSVESTQKILDKINAIEDPAKKMVAKIMAAKTLNMSEPDLERALKASSKLDLNQPTPVVKGEFFDYASRESKKLPATWDGQFLPKFMETAANWIEGRAEQITSWLNGTELTEQEKADIKKNTDKLAFKILKKKRETKANSAFDTSREIAMNEAKALADEEQRKEAYQTKYEGAGLYDKYKMLAEKIKELKLSQLWDGGTPETATRTQKELNDLYKQRLGVMKEIRDVNDKIQDKYKLKVDELIDDKGNWKVRPMDLRTPYQRGLDRFLGRRYVSPAEQNNRMAWEIKNSESWSEQYRLQGRPDLAMRAQANADNLRKNMQSLTSGERDPNRSMRENIEGTYKTNKDLLKAFEAGTAKVKVANGK